MNTERSVAEYTPGFAEVSAFLSFEEEKQGGLCRRFRRLSVRNLLYMQAELAVLEDRMAAIDRKDAAAMVSTDLSEKNRAIQCAIDWDTLVREGATDGPQKHRIDLIKEIRYSTKAYRTCSPTFKSISFLFSANRLVKDALIRIQYEDEAVLLDAEIARLPSPSHDYLQMFQRFVQRRPHSSIAMRGPQLEEVSRQELLVTYSSAEADRLTKLIRQIVTSGSLSLLETNRTVPPSWQDISFYSDDLIEKVVAVLAVILAAGLLIGGITALDYVEGNRKGIRLGILAAFTIAFAGLIGLFTNARRAELFAATAGFTAVLVVYVAAA